MQMSNSLTSICKVRKSGKPKLNRQPSAGTKLKKSNVPKQKQGTVLKKKRKISTNLSLGLHPFSKKSNLKSLRLPPGIFSKKSLNFPPPLFLGNFSPKGGEVESNTTDSKFEAVC